MGKKNGISKKFMETEKWNYDMRKQSCLHSVRLQSQKRENNVIGCVSLEDM